MSKITVTILGSGGSGKSSLTVRFISHSFLESYNPTIEDVYRKTVTVDNELCHLSILDTAGQEEFHVLADGWIREADGVILVYDITNHQTFEEVQRLYERVLFTKDKDRFPIVLVGNKCDVPSDQRGVTTEEGERLARLWKCSFIECSAKECIRETECFSQIVRAIRSFHAPLVKDEKSYSCSCVLL